MKNLHSDLSDKYPKIKGKNKTENPIPDSIKPFAIPFYFFKNYFIWKKKKKKITQKFDFYGQWYQIVNRRGCDAI